MPSLFWFSVVWFLLILATSFWFRKGNVSPRWQWGALVIGSLLQVVLGAWGLVAHATSEISSLPGIPPFGTWIFSFDPLASLMFVILGLTGVISSLYAIGQSQRSLPGTGWASASMVALQFVFTSFLLTAQDAIPLLIAWEGMSLSAYAYIGTRHEVRRVRQVAFVTLAVSEIGFLALVIAVVLAAPISGSLSFAALHASLVYQSPAIRDIVLVLGLIGFGVKSGVLPMQIWMPRAYDVTPAHLNVLLAGGLLNLGIFGILRVVDWVGMVSSIWGILFVLIGAIAVFLGALYAVMERRIGMLLAYSSIENVGFMVIGIGLFISFKATHASIFAAVALFAVLVQMVSHSLAKSVCFLSAGELQRRTGTSDLNALGGLYRQMPVVATGFLVGSLTLAAVAPFSGFIAEWLTLQSMLQAYRTLSGFEQTLVILAGALTALGSALAFTAFLRLFAFLFSGELRQPMISNHLRRTGGSRTAQIAILILASLSALYGFFPTSLMHTFGTIVAFLESSTNPVGNVVPNVFHQPGQFAQLVALGGNLLSFLPMPSAVVQPGAGVSSIAPTYLLGWFLMFSLLAYAIQRGLGGPFQTRTVRPWTGGQIDDPATAQYSATAYSNPYRMFFASLLNFGVHRTVASGTSLLPRRVSVRTRMTLWLQSTIYQRWIAWIRKHLAVVQRMQHGYLWGYLTLFILTLVVLLIWVYLQ